MVGPIALPIALAAAGWLTAEWAGLITGFGVGLLVSVAVMSGAIWWSRNIGDLLERDDAIANAPRPPGFGPLCDWVYRRTL